MHSILRRLLQDYVDVSTTALMSQQCMCCPEDSALSVALMHVCTGTCLPVYSMKVLMF
jgi:hypothetical protein